MQREPIRLVILIQDLEFGGTQRYAINLLKGMDRRRFRPELWVLRGGFDMLPMAEEAGVRIRWLSKASFVGPPALIRLMWALVWLRPRVLYTLTVVPNIWGRLIGKLAGVPVVVSGYRNLFPRQYERWLWPASRRIICNAEALKGIMIRRCSVDAARIAVIPNAVDTDWFSPAPGRKSSVPTVLFIGRLVEEKAPLDLLKAFSLLHARIPEARLEMVGDGPLRSLLERHIRDHSLGAHVSLVPGVKDTRPWMEKAWVFSLPSIQEASPNVILEAMAVGLPVVATRVGGIPEIVVEGHTGVLVEPGDTGALAQALAALLSDPPRRAAVGSHARQRVLAEHSLEAMVRRTEAVLLDAATRST